MNVNPYLNIPESHWQDITAQLIRTHPLTPYLVDLVMDSWRGLFNTSFGMHSLKIGEDIFPKPQIIGAILHELIPASIEAQFPQYWRKEENKNDKDIVCKYDNSLSVELKTSSNSSQIFGNRSYAQPQNGEGKIKDGFYLAVNFQPFSLTNATPQILKIRFGWLAHTDWIAQLSSTGQQARLASNTYQKKFITLYG
ncbi:ScaI family restriction endonuclease [Escherichia marmotae]|uniref:ScaI family restriction endonuclease n=1 Tax=Escherichia marmotae TaxID=1499973 RepID=UPI001650A502|nr:ScaI family restriction endonuclease [Escherichia marmotae]MEC9791831.1 ScaI family restriction endonuclease [Escherichia marmotae]MED9401413.1 ScaI family restriction endonuclease [Escherichia marmotae]MED9481891.1 ScaI family restriction endonuclease [Escherichia marmotae]